VRSGAARVHTVHTLRPAALVATAAREAQRRAKLETDRERGKGRASWGGGFTDHHPDAAATRQQPSLGLAAASLQQEWGRLLKLPAIRTTIRRQQPQAMVTRRRSAPAVPTSSLLSSSSSSSSHTLASGLDGRRRGHGKEQRVCARTATMSESGSAAQSHGAGCASRGDRDRLGRGCCHGDSNANCTGSVESVDKSSVCGDERSQTTRQPRHAESHPSERPVIVPAPPTMAQRLRLVAPPPQPLTCEEWSACKAKAVERGNVTAEPCAICMTSFGIGRQVLLNCTHVFHMVCLRSYERHTGKSICPVCRLEQYQGYEITDGARYCRNTSATTIQAAWRGYATRKALEKTGSLPRSIAIPRAQRRLVAATDRLTLSIRTRVSAVDDFLAELDVSTARCKAIISDAHRERVRQHAFYDLFKLCVGRSP
jgi:hypothetical protein